MPPDSHDDWRELNWAYKFPDGPCRYDGETAATCAPRFRNLDRFVPSPFLYAGAVVNTDGSVTLRVPRTLSPGFEVVLVRE